MQYTCPEFPYVSKKISICDARIDDIQCSDNVVRFVFSEGFYVVSGGTIGKSVRGCVELSDCGAEEFTCYIIRRESTPRGAKLYGEEISLSDLANMLAVEKRKIEVFLELYDYEYLYWRGVLLPYNNEGLSDHIILETSGRFPVTYYWE